MLDTLSLDAATSFLLARTGTDDSEAARELAALTGGLPLALEQAAAYVAEHKLSLTKYLKLYRRRANELWKRGQPAFYEHTVATTWTLAFEDIATTLPAAGDMLKACAFLASEGVPRSLFDFARDGALPSLTDELVRADAVALLQGIH